MFWGRPGWLNRDRELRLFVKKHWIHLRGRWLARRAKFFASRLQSIAEKTNWGRGKIPKSFLAVRESSLGLSEAQSLITSYLERGQPAFVGRLGGIEIQAMLESARLESWGFRDRLIWGLLTGDYSRWREDRFRFMSLRAGFFPWNDRSSIARFAELMRGSAAQLDLLGAWRPGENLLDFRPELEVTRLAFLEPFEAETPWTAALAGKKVLVVHPFAESIRSQYERRALLFDRPDILPKFHLTVVRAVQSLHAPGTRPDVPFESWFCALEAMQDQISKIEFDVAIIGAGAYGFPLAAFVKRLGKIAIHLGGSTQLLFGIWGGRWDSSPLHVSLRNSHWVRPLPAETPLAAGLVEEKRYW